MTAWVREEQNAPENRQRKREAEEVGKVEVASGVPVVGIRGYGLWGRSIARTPVSVEVGVKVTVLVPDTVSVLRRLFPSLG